MFALDYSMLHRFEIFSAPGTIAQGSVRLTAASQPRVFARLLVGNKLCIRFTFTYVHLIYTLDTPHIHLYTPYIHLYIPSIHVLFNYVKPMYNLNTPYLHL